MAVGRTPQPRYLTTQTSNHMKRTYQPSKRRRVKTHGFRARTATAGGRAVIKRRRSKGRNRAAVTA